MAARRLLTTITVDYSLSCAHEQKAHGGAVDRRGQQNAVFAMPYQTIRSIIKEVSDLAIFVQTTDTNIALPLLRIRARGN